MTHGADLTVPIAMLEARISNHCVDIGYVLAQRFWGQGLMSEAVRRFAAIALATSPIFRVQGACDAENVGSARVLEKSEFSREGTLQRFAVHPNASKEPRACHMYARCRSLEPSTAIENAA